MVNIVSGAGQGGEVVSVSPRGAPGLVNNIVASSTLLGGVHSAAVLQFRYRGIALTGIEYSLTISPLCCCTPVQVQGVSSDWNRVQLNYQSTLLLYSSSGKGG